MKDLITLVQSCRESPLTQVSPISVCEAICLIREADNPELAAAYQRNDELESTLREVRRIIHEAGPWGHGPCIADQFPAETLDLIDIALDDMVIP
ncbi:hypothetical protein [Bradyrhizobium sp. Tv2a-2]|uniref:hypothetical protein n=1 Tax=Bradyrhizobium sp. Tv2a-2 TaxID=113395 RepID=UPI000429C573|nr:hypothetical protein [Bradyrhizobium sp. Tv2a-2]